MTVTFYNYSGEINRLNKTPFMTTVKTISNIKPYNNFDIQNPFLVVDYDSTIVNCNYVQIDGMYYHVISPAYETGSRLNFNLMKDVLMTNKADILQSKCIALRTGTDNNNYSSYLQDNAQLFYSYKTICTKLIGTFNYSANTILITAG